MRLGRKAGGRRAAFSALPQDPARTDYILRAPVAAELSQGPAVLAALLDQLQHAGQA